MEKNPCTLTIGPVRLSYVNVFEAKSMEEGQPAKYSLSAIIPKSDKATIKRVNAAIEAAKELGKENKWEGKLPPNLKLPLRDGDVDRPDDAPYEKAMFLNCNSPQRPGVVDAARNAITDKEEVYSGCYGYVNITFYPFKAAGSKGVAVGLNHVMKTKDGERLSGRVSIDDAFEGIEISEEDNDLM